MTAWPEDTRLSQVVERLRDSGDHIPLGLSLLIIESLAQGTANGSDAVEAGDVIVHADGTVTCAKRPTASSLAALWRELAPSDDPTIPLEPSVFDGIEDVPTLVTRIAEARHTHQLGGDSRRLMEFVRFVMTSRAKPGEEVITLANEYRRRRVLRALVVTGVFAWAAAGVFVFLRWLF